MEEKIVDFLEKLSSKSPTPGGGSVSALLGALSCALGNMVCNLTLGKKKYLEFEPENAKTLSDLTQAVGDFRRFYDDDIRVFQKLSETYRLPSTTPEEKESKAQTMEPLLVDAIKVPLAVMELCVDVLSQVEGLCGKTSVLAVSDLGVSASCAKACLESAILNVYINSAAMTNRPAAEEFEQHAETFLKTGLARADAIIGKVAGELRTKS